MAPSLPSLKTLEGLQAFADDTNEIGTIGGHQWNAFWTQVEAIVGPQLGHTLPTRDNDSAAARAVGKALLRYLDARGEAKTPMASGAVKVLEWLSEYSLHAEPSVRDLAGKVLDVFCASEAEGHEQFYGGLLMNSILRVLDSKATLADVSRLHRHRHYLPALDWDDESIEDLKTRLLHCVMSGLVLRSPEAPSLLAYFFTLNAAFVQQLHACVKNQLPVCRASMVNVYASAYYKAWKASTAGVRIQTEMALQEWMHWAVLSTPHKAVKARSILSEFHNNRDNAVEEMLTRLYAPILWRNLKVANWKVRLNATALLSVAFPIVEPNLGVGEHEEAMALQYNAFLSLMNDPHEEVRRVAVSGVCKVLNRFWELVPAGIAAQLLGEMFERCAKDKNSANVRAAVPEGMAVVLQNPLSHAAMAGLLPALGPLLDDRSPLVRCQFAKLLRAVSFSKQISCFSISSQPELLARLAREHELAQHDPRPHVPVAQNLVALMAPSLFEQETKEQVKRCVFLAKRYPAAFLPLLHHCNGRVPDLDRLRLAVACFSTAISRCGDVREAAEDKDAASVSVSQAWTDQLSVTLMLLRGSRTLLKSSRDHKSTTELQNFLHQHIKDELIAPFFAEEYNLRGPLAVCLAECDPLRLPMLAGIVSDELARLWDSQGLLGHVKDSEVWALIHLAHAWNRIEPLEQRVLGNTEELGTLLLEHEAAVGEGRPPAAAVQPKRALEMKQSVEVLAELFKRPAMRPSHDVRMKVVQLADGIASLQLAATKRTQAALRQEFAAELSAPLDVSLLGFPPFLVELLPEVISVLGRAALQGDDAAQPLGALMKAFTDPQVANLVERLRLCGKKQDAKASKKAKLAWTAWHVESATAARVYEHLVQQIIVANLAGQVGLAPKLPALCAQMIAWGQVSDWLARLSGETGNAGQAAWNCAASAVKQLAFAKAPACHVCDLAGVVFKQANQENTPHLAVFLLKRFEHAPELKTLIQQREEWPATVAHCVEELAVGFPGVSAVVNGMSDTEDAAPRTPPRQAAEVEMSPI